MPSINIDRDDAHQIAQIELNKPIYPKASSTQQVLDWINEMLYRLLQKSASIPGGWLTTAVLLVLVAVAVVIAIHIARRTMRTRYRGDYQLFEAALLTAAQHRETAERYVAEGDWTAAIRHRLRAVARQLEETGVLNPVPGRTAKELACDAAAALPHLTDELTQAATAFNDVTYGELPGTQDAYQMIVDLDDHLRMRTPVAGSTACHAAPARSSAEVR
ncbi:DUF4129 domain-containing protein [Mycobacterium tilburgii]|uniref:DUF4129 domain-containing protein n=1 Tax=Mycobacterium tilburgii TaxID=44467 RepID=UPI001182284D|nr:DUF4129 domain-containing protein [Mycobacterium tilburgii]